GTDRVDGLDLVAAAHRLFEHDGDGAGTVGSGPFGANEQGGDFLLDVWDVVVMMVAMIVVMVMMVMGMFAAMFLDGGLEGVSSEEFLAIELAPAIDGLADRLFVAGDEVK